MLQRLLHAEMLNEPLALLSAPGGRGWGLLVERFEVGDPCADEV